VWGCGVYDSSLSIMKLATIDDYEEGYENEDTLDIKQLNSISKLKDPFANMEARMERFKKPTLEKDFAYFMQIGLSGSRINLRWLKAGQDVAHEKLMETFGKVIPCLGFCYTKCWDPKIKTKVENFWPLCYGKAKNLCSKLIAKKIALGIIVETLNKDVNWVTFAEETNINEHNKFFKRMARIGGLEGKVDENKIKFIAKNVDCLLKRNWPWLKKQSQKLWWHHMYLKNTHYFKIMDIEAPK
jgi:hypothetical protein